MPHVAPEKTVRLPCSAGRRDASSSWVLVLKRVRRVSAIDFAFDGSHHKAGSTIPLDTLFPAGSDVAVVLEYAGPDRSRGLRKDSQGSGQARYPEIRILWEIDSGTLTWRELARAASFDRSWVIGVGAAACAALGRAERPGSKDSVSRVLRAYDAILKCVEASTADYEDGESLSTIGMVCDQLTSMIASRAGGWRAPLETSIELDLENLELVRRPLARAPASIAGEIAAPEKRKGNG